MSDHSRFLILLGGSLETTGRLRAQIDGARVLAADGGMAHAANLCVPTPNGFGVSGESGVTFPVRTIIFIFIFVKVKTWKKVRNVFIIVRVALQRISIELDRYRSLTFNPGTLFTF